MSEPIFTVGQRVRALPTDDILIKEYVGMIGIIVDMQIGGIFVRFDNGEVASFTVDEIEAAQ